MKHFLFSGFVLLAGFCSVAQVQAVVRLSDSARLFGRDVISTGDFEFNASFTPDGNTMYFSRATINFGYIAIFYSTYNGRNWSTPETVPFTGVYRDTDPFVSADGMRLYFDSDRPIKGMPYKDYDYHYYYVNLDGNRVISDPEPFTLPLPVGMKPSYLSFTDAGDAYFFSVDSSNNADIYCCEKKGDSYGPPILLSFNSKKYFDFDPVIAHDGSFIVFCSNNRPGYGSGDIWVSFRSGQAWTEPANMGPKVNTKGNDGAPGLSRDNQTLYFTSFRETNMRPSYSKNKATTAAIEALLHSVADGIRHIYVISIADINARSLE